MPAANEFDLVILGGGTGGYVAAIRASQLGLKVAIVEKAKLGGTCLHKGCIPSKSLLRSAEVFHTLKQCEEYGVEATNIAVNFGKMQQRKKKIIDQLHKGVQQLMRKGNICVFYGEGRIMGPSIFSPQAGAVAVSKENGESEILVPKYLLIATGARPQVLPEFAVDGKFIITSDEALELEELPKSVVIVGGGAIGIEWASLLNDLGVQVTLIELAQRILPREDADISKEMSRLLKKRKIAVHTGATVLPDSFDVRENQVFIRAESNGKILQFQAEKLLVSVGRKANIENIGLENTEIKVHAGAIQVSEMFQTGESHIYAIGDVIGGLQLAHVASHEGIIAVEHIAGLSPQPLDYSMVPKVTYCRPEVASVGYTEQEAREKGFSVKTGTFNFRAIGKALVYGEYDGFVKLIMDEKTEDILGIHMIGPNVSDLIAEGALARLLDATPWEVSKTLHPHPSLSEIMGEAALAIQGLAIHS
jgi:dihydrolipoamide dehydrogenase